jgi:hypothetical protein
MSDLKRPEPHPGFDVLGEDVEIVRVKAMSSCRNLSHLGTSEVEGMYNFCIARLHQFIQFQANHEVSCSLFDGAAQPPKCFSTAFAGKGQHQDAGAKNRSRRAGYHQPCHQQVDQYASADAPPIADC